MSFAHLKRLLAGAAAAITLVLLAASTASAHAEPVTIITQAGVQVFDNDVNCLGVVGTTTVTYREALHVTEGPDIPFHYSVHQTGTVTFVPNDPASVVYAGHFSYDLEFNTTGPTNTEVGSQRLAVKTTGSDGSTLWCRSVVHQTLNAEHELTASFDRSSCA
jgi:hypothetical protein